MLCASPIGNLGDTSPRLLEVLAKADVIYAEDTRRATRLLRRHAIDRAARSYFVGNEAERAVQLRDELANGMTVALLTDAGTPSVSDPGLSAVRAALEAGATVTTVAGPSAVTAALAVSGLPADRFVFEGFLPGREPGAPRCWRPWPVSSAPRSYSPAHGGSAPTWAIWRPSWAATAEWWWFGS